MKSNVERTRPAYYVNRANRIDSETFRAVGERMAMADADYAGATAALQTHVLGARQMGMLSDECVQRHLHRNGTGVDLLRIGFDTAGIQIIFKKTYC